MEELEKQMDFIARERDWLKLTTAKKPTWVDKTRTEGVEIQGNRLVSFWVKDGERVYDEPPSQQVQSILDGLNPKPEPKSKPKQESKPEPKQDVTNTPKKAIMPDVIPRALFDKVSFEDVFLQAQTTAPQHVKHRPGRGGEYAYVEGWYVKQILNLATKWKWESHIDGWKETETEVICWGSVTITLPSGEKITQAGVGQADKKFKKGTKELLCLGDDYKAAMTDMIKKAVSHWGIANDVYRGEV